MKKKKWGILCLLLSFLLIIAACSQKTDGEIVDTTSESIGTESENLETNEQEKEEEQETVENNEKEEEEIGEEEIVEEVGFVSPYHFEYPDAVRGIYVTGHSAGGARFERLLELVNTTDLNSMVIDIKDDHGYLTFRPEEDSPYYPFSQRYIKDIQALLKTLEEHKIYPIARIVVFKDSVMAKEKPEWSFKENGSVWKNRRGESFVNPFVKEVWEYNVEIAKLAAELGFKDIQFDYVRFPEGFEKRDEILSYSLGEYKERKPVKLSQLEEAYKLDLMEYKSKLKELTEEAGKSGISEEDKDRLKKEIEELEKKKPLEPSLSSKETAVQLRVDAVTDFVAYAKQELSSYNVHVSVDIFGYTATLPEAPGIGQNFTRISSHVDVISSMIYPSHWTAYFGISKPDLEPYRLVEAYSKVENEKLNQLENRPISRPWIQDFTASWLGSGNYKKYGVKEVEDQIRALNEAGIWEYLLWNANNNYTMGVNYLPIGPNPDWKLE